MTNIYTSQLSIRVRHGEIDNERERIQKLNERFAEVEQEFADLNLMLFGFPEEDFYNKGEQ